jgi:peptide/nickel transport system permease protein
MIVVLMWLVIIVLSPWIMPSDSLAQSAALFEPPSAHHWFGTDELGRDVLSRVIAGARVSIPLGLVLVALEVLIGGVLGSIAGYYGGRVDGVIMRITDLVFVFPTILLAMVIASTWS